VVGAVTAEAGRGIATLRVTRMKGVAPLASKNSRGQGNGPNPNNSRGQGNSFRGGSRNRPKNHVSFAVFPFLHRTTPSVCPVWRSITLYRPVPTQYSQPGRKSRKEFPNDRESTEFKKHPTVGEPVSSVPSPYVNDYVCLTDCGPNLLYLEVRIGSQPSSALLDTGASMSCIDPSLSIEKKPVFPREVNGQTGK
jgi:hypothetical protein